MSERMAVMPARSELVLEGLPHIDERDSQITEYSIAVEGRSAGYAALEYNASINEMSIALILLDPGQQGQGHGKQTYENIADLCVEQGRVFTSGDTLTHASKRMWKSFERDGRAIQRQDGRYEMLSFDQSNRER